MPCRIGQALPAPASSWCVSALQLVRIRQRLVCIRGGVVRITQSAVDMTGRRLGHNHRNSSNNLLDKTIAQASVSECHSLWHKLQPFSFGHTIVSG